MQDTYYVVAHFEWVVMLMIASFCLIALLTLIRRNNTHTWLGRWAGNSLRIWTLGLMLTLFGTIAARFLPFETIITSPWISNAINASLTIGAFVLVLSIAVALVLTVLWIWFLLHPTAE